jgi:DNA invertase Pin-like site-specific DNA recombinase
MLVGYMRVSTTDQEIALQEDALRRIGCEQIFSDTASGASLQRVGLKRALDFTRSGDVFVVWRLDRLGRSLQHLIEIVTALEKRGAGFKSLTELIDTTTSSGRLVFQIFASLAEFERSLIQERTHAGLKAARARGRFGGRPLILNANKIAMVKQLYAAQVNTVAEIAKIAGISRVTVYNYLRLDENVIKRKVSL